jgi:hypothetical protein
MVRRLVNSQRLRTSMVSEERTDEKHAPGQDVLPAGAWTLNGNLQRDS